MMRHFGRSASRLLSSARNQVEKDIYDRSRQIIPLGNRVPTVAVDAFVAPNATLVGDVRVCDKASVWYGAVLRGDRASISIGPFSNVQDRVIISTAA